MPTQESQTDHGTDQDQRKASLRRNNSSTSRFAVKNSRRRFLQTLAVGGSLVAAGCGQTQPGTQTGTATEGGSPTPTTEPSTDDLPHVSGQTFRAAINQDPSKVTFVNRFSYEPSSYYGLNRVGYPLQRVLWPPGMWPNKQVPGKGAQVYYNWYEEPVDLTPTELKISIRDDAKWSDGHQITGKDIATLPLQFHIQEGQPPHYASEETEEPSRILTIPDGFDVTEQSVTYRSSGGYFDQFWEIDIAGRLGMWYGPLVIPTHVEPYASHADAILETVRKAQNGEIDPWAEDSDAPNKVSLRKKHLDKEKWVKKFAKAENVLTVGPWDLVELRGSEAFVFEKNSHHRNADRINFDTKILEYTSSEDRKRAALKAGRLDYAAADTATPQTVVDSFPDSIETVHRPSGSGNELLLNFRHPALGTRKVRMAMMYALDQPTIAKNIHPSTTVPITTPGGDNWNATDYVSQDWIDENLTTYSTNREKAATLMREAGYTEDGGQWMDADGEVLTLTFTTRSETPVWEQTVASQLSEFGIETSVHILSEDKNIKTLENYDIREYDHARTTGHAYSTLSAWLWAAIYPKTWGIFPDEQFETGKFKGGRPVPYSEERYDAFTIKAPPIGEPNGPLEEYHPAALSLFWFSNPPEDEFRHRIKTGIWLANWFLPTIPINNMRNQYFVDGTHWLWPRDTSAWKSFTSGGARYETLIATDGIRANPDNPEEGASTN